MKADSTPSSSTKIQGGGERGEEKSKAHKANKGANSIARNTMGKGKKSANGGSTGSMGKNQSTGDGGASNW